MPKAKTYGEGGTMPKIGEKQEKLFLNLFNHLVLFKIKEK